MASKNNNLPVAVLLALVALGSMVGTTQARSHVAAWLDGRITSVERAAEHQCIAARELRCYTSPAARDAAWHRRVASSAGSESGLASGYVIAYIDATFGGASVVLAQDYSDLSAIGWNDRISSYKVFTSLTGSFWSAAFFSGSRQTYCCFTNVSYVGNALNDTFSSFDLP